jgi:hypothetical protein
MKWKWFIVGILLYIGILYPISFFTFSSLFPILCDYCLQNQLVK